MRSASALIAAGAAWKATLWSSTESARRRAPAPRSPGADRAGRSATGDQPRRTAARRDRNRRRARPSSMIPLGASGTMAENGARSTEENGGHAVPLDREALVADGMNATVDLMQAAGTYPYFDLASSESDPLQLRYGNYAVLPRSSARHPAVPLGLRRGAPPWRYVREAHRIGGKGDFRCVHGPRLSVARGGRTLQCRNVTVGAGFEARAIRPPTQGARAARPARRPPVLSPASGSAIRPRACRPAAPPDPRSGPAPGSASRGRGG